MTEVLLQAECAREHTWDVFGIERGAEIPSGGSYLVIGEDTVVPMGVLRCPTCQPTQPAVRVTEPESLA